VSIQNDLIELQYLKKNSYTAHCVNNRNRRPKIIRLGKTTLDDEDQRDPTDIAVEVVLVFNFFS
jgi:hypothetical protein